MKIRGWMMAGGAGLLLLAGCQSMSPIQQRQRIGRPEFGEDVIAVNASSKAEAEPVKAGGPTLSGAKAPVVSGTWEFTTPTTVTRMKKSTEKIDQYSLYNGRPAPTDTPFVVITTSAEAKSLVEAGPADYTVKETKTYLLNGLPTREINGYTKGKQPFCELIVLRADGDQLHAMAVAKNDDERKLALGILGSITWKPNQ